MHQRQIRHSQKAFSRLSARKYGNCLAYVIEHQDLIQPMRELCFSLDEIAQHFGMSTSSLRAALKQIKEAKSPAKTMPPPEFTPPNAVCLMYPRPEPSERLKQWMRNIHRANSHEDCQ